MNSRYDKQPETTHNADRHWTVRNIVIDRQAIRKKRSLFNDPHPETSPSIRLILTKKEFMLYKKHAILTAYIYIQKPHHK